MSFKRSRVGQYLKRRRFKRIDQILDHRLTDHNSVARVLEVGVGYGVDFMPIAAKNTSLELYGIDIDEARGDPIYNHIQGDAQYLEFPDKFFDVVVSFGVLEHIQPIEKLSRTILEIERVSKSYCIVVPAISTIFEPHMASFFWQLRDRNKKPPHPRGWLNYFSDEAWLQFQGFRDAKTRRFTYMPLVTQLLIHKTASG